MLGDLFGAVRRAAAKVKLYAPTNRVGRGFERRGPWISLFEIKGRLYGGEVDFRGDRRIREFMAAFPEIRNLLELGSLEGAHSFQLAPHVERLVALEGRAESIKRARYVQKLLAIENVTFVEANLESARPSDFGSFDAIFCVGLLYHLPEPWRLLDSFRDVAPQVFLETHYAADAEKQVQGIAGRDYAEAGRVDPLSGLSPLSFWMTLDEIITRLERNGYRVRVLRDEPDTKHGPLAAFVAEL